MYKASAYLLLPLMLINLTVAENRWTVFDLRPDQFIYAATVMMAWYIGLRSRYRDLITAMILLTIVFRLLFITMQIDLFRQMGFGSLAVVFGVAGAIIYGRDPSLLQKQLTAYLALCIPIMILQVLGVSSFLMGWNIGYAHDPSILSMGEIGTFKEVPLYPTLFVRPEDFVGYSIGQGRPVGLMYGSNPLSIFISIAIAVNLAISRTSRISFSDYVVTIVSVLSMSKLVFGCTVILYLWFFVFNVQGKRILVLKIVAILMMTLFFYYILFPGLFMHHFNKALIMTSIMLRLVDLLKAGGVYDYLNSSNQLTEMATLYKPGVDYQVEEGYTFLAILLRSKLLIPSLLIIFVVSIVYVYRLRKMVSRETMVYVATLVACILTQFGVPFAKTPSFQLIVGFSLFPLFKGLWAPYSHLREEIQSSNSGVFRKDNRNRKVITDAL